MFTHHFSGPIGRECLCVWTITHELYDLRCDFSIYQDGSRPPSLIYYPRFWLTHEAYLVVFTGVQNLVGIHAVVTVV